jgi:hypothetical protein
VEQEAIPELGHSASEASYDLQREPLVYAGLSLRPHWGGIRQLT